LRRWFGGHHSRGRVFEKMVQGPSLQEESIREDNAGAITAEE
jgi:hypothetical protein